MAYNPQKSNKHPFDLNYPHILSWVKKRKGIVSISRNQFSVIQAYTKDDHLVWADFGKYGNIDAALGALNTFLASTQKSSSQPDPTQMEGLSFLRNSWGLPFTIGHTHEEIQTILGPPEDVYAPVSSSPSSTTDFDIWNYGELYIYFREGCAITFCLYIYSLQNSEFYPQNSSFQFRGIESFHDDEDDWPELFESLGLEFETDLLSDNPSYHFENGIWFVDFPKLDDSNNCSNYYVGYGESSLPRFEEALNQAHKLAPLKTSFLKGTKFEEHFPVCSSCLEIGMTLSLHGQSKKIIQRDQNGSDFNDAKLYPFSIGKKINEMEASSKSYLPKREALNSTKITLSSFFKTGKFGPIELGMTKAQVLETFGPPETNVDIPSGCSLMESVIWLYNSLEFYFYESKAPESAELHQISRSSLYYHYKEWAEEGEKDEGLRIISDISDKPDPPNLREVLAFARAQNLNVSFQHYYQGQFKAIFDSGVFFMFFLEGESEISFDDAIEKGIDLPAEYLGLYASDLLPNSKKPCIPFVL